MNQPLCKFLRTKKLYTGSSPEIAFADKETHELTPCHFWCNLTQTVVGPDDQPVHKETCTATRPCFTY